MISVRSESGGSSHLELDSSDQITVAGGANQLRPLIGQLVLKSPKSLDATLISGV